MLALEAACLRRMFAKMPALWESALQRRRSVCEFIVLMLS